MQIEAAISIVKQLYPLVNET